MTESRQRLGTTADGGYVVVDISLTEQTGEHQTIEHETVGALLRFSIVGAHYEKGARRDNPSMIGRISLDIITKPAAGWTLEEIAELGELWDRWHLNDMRAGCAHQTVVWEDAPYRRPSLELTAPCPKTGYRYGSAWLVEILPADVLARIRHLARDRSQDLYKARGYDASGRAV